MSEFSYQLIEDTAKDLYIRALKVLPPDVKEALKGAYERETHETAKQILQTILSSELIQNLLLDPGEVTPDVRWSHLEPFHLTVVIQDGDEISLMYLKERL